MMGDHISVCICTYKRPKFLAKLLGKLQHQITNKLFGYSVVVVDNDRLESGRSVVESLMIGSKICIDYYNEPEQNIALARNRAVQNVKGDFLAFIDDDELPAEDWLLKLHKSLLLYKADGVLGPVKPCFDESPPDWILQAGLFERPSHNTGTVLHWDDTRTGNVLLKSQLFHDKENVFNPAFKHGEDKDFFRRMMEKGFIFVWCEEAPVYETEPSERFKRSYFLKRALLRGSVSLRHRSSKIVPVLKSFAAFGIYTCALPFLLFAGQYLFMKYLVKDCDHIGRLFRACGLDIEKYLL